MRRLVELTRRRNVEVAALVLVVFSGLLYSQLVLRNEEAGLEKEFPKGFRDWASVEVRLNSEVLGVLGADQIVYRRYQRDGHLPVTLFIAAYGSLEKTDLSHSPVVCFTGQGWNIEQAEKKKIDVGRKREREVVISQIVQTRGDTRMLAYYWYQSGGDVYSNRGLQKLVLFWRRLLGGNESNAFIRLTATVPAEALFPETAAEVTRFVQEAYPEIVEFLS